MITIDEAREYLKDQCIKHFKDKSFEHYIDRKLAGDFAVEIAELIHKLYDRNISSYKQGFVSGYEFDKTKRR